MVLDPDTRGIKQSSAQTSYTGSTRKAEEFIALDLSDVGRGRRLDIVVRVTDEVTGQTMERKAGFGIVR